MAETSLARRLTDVQRAYMATGMPTGMGRRLGNKGVVVVRMVIAREVTLCLVCCHMCAHREKVAERNAEYKIITEQKLFISHTM